jgi:MFS superfamily sulfate permease-like transporter
MFAAIMMVTIGFFQAIASRVVLFGVLEGILIAVVVSILLFFKRGWWPHGAVLGQVEGQDGWHSVSSAPAAVQRPGVLVYRWEAPLFFANAGMHRDHIRRLVRDGRRVACAGRRRQSLDLESPTVSDHRRAANANARRELQAETDDPATAPKREEPLTTKET